MENFTPLSGLAGGLLIGLSTALLMLMNGRITGISGIVGGLLARKGSEVAWRAMFAGGPLARRRRLCAGDGRDVPGQS